MVVVRVHTGEGRVSRARSKEYNETTLHLHIKLFMNKVQISGERKESISCRGNHKQSRKGRHKILGNNCLLLKLR